MEKSAFCMLCAANFEDAIEFIKNIDVKYIKNKNKLEYVITYLDRKKEFGCCYAMHCGEN